MAENHIHRLIRERDEAQQQLADVREALADLRTYLASSKFQGLDADYIHIRTDLVPKLIDLGFKAI